MSFNRGRDRVVTTLTNYLPDRLVSILLDKRTAVHPHDLVGKSIGDLFRLNGFGYSAFGDFVKAMWRMGLHFDANGVIRENSDPMPRCPKVDAEGKPVDIIIGKAATIGGPPEEDTGPIGHPNTQLPDPVQPEVPEPKKDMPVMCSHKKCDNHECSHRRPHRREEDCSTPHVCQEQVRIKHRLNENYNGQTDEEMTYKVKDSPVVSCQ